MEDIEYLDKGRLDDEVDKPYYKGLNENKQKYDNQQLSPVKAPKTAEYSLPLNKYEAKSKYR